MLAELVANADAYIQGNPWLAVAAVFAGGLLTASNPCCLAMVPLMMGFVAGRDGKRATALSGFLHSLVFVAGLIATFIAMGMIAALAGKMYGQVSALWTAVVVVVCVAMGLHLLGVLPLKIPALVKAQPKLRGPLGALLLGLLFGLVSAPCAAPVLVVVLTYLAGTQASVPYGGFLLAVYGLGHSALLIVAGTSVGLAQTYLASRRMTAATARLRQASGLVIIAVGVYFGYRGFLA